MPRFTDIRKTHAALLEVLCLVPLSADAAGNSWGAASIYSKPATARPIVRLPTDGNSHGVHLDAWHAVPTALERHGGMKSGAPWKKVHGHQIHLGNHHSWSEHRHCLRRPPGHI